MRVLIFVMTVLATMMAWAAPSPSKIRIGTEWVMPYTGLTEKGTPTGYIYDILEEIAKKYNYKVEYVEIPALRQIQALQKDEIDYAIMSVQLVRYSSNVELLKTPFGVTYAGAMTVGPGGFESLYDFADLAGKSLLVSYMGPETDKFREAIEQAAAGKKTEIVEVNGTNIAKRMMLMMSSKRADVAIGDYNVLRYAAALQAKGPQNKMNVIPSSLAGFGAVVALSRKEKPGLKKFDKDVSDWFEDARRSGRLNKILKKYNLTDWENLLPY